jgi:hypothetical protein
MKTSPVSSLFLSHKMILGANQNSDKGFTCAMIKPVRLVQYLIVLCLTVATMLNTIQLAQAQDSTPTKAATPISIIVSGRVTSGTAGVSIPADTPMLLQIAHPDPKTGKATETAKQQTALTADNHYQFDSVPAYAGDIVFISAVFQGIQQVGVPITVSNQPSIVVPLTLYAVSNDPSIVSVLRVQHILDFQPGLMQVLATYDFRNSSDKVFVSKDHTPSQLPISLSMPLPIGAQAIAFTTQNDERFSIGGTVNAPVVVDTKPLTPGQVQQVVFSYQLPYASGVPIDQDYPFGANVLEVLIPADANVMLKDTRINGALIDAGQLATTIDTSMNAKRQYVKYTLTVPLKPADRVIYTLAKGQSAVTTTSNKATEANNTSRLLNVLLIGAVIFVGMAGLIVFMRQRSTNRSK